MEVAVVGAGIVGLACAFHLQAEGVSVRLIERGGIADGRELRQCRRLRVLGRAAAGLARHPAPGAGLGARSPRAAGDPAGLPAADRPVAAAVLARRSARPLRPLAHRAGRPDAARRRRDGADGGGANLGAHLRRDGNLELYESEAGCGPRSPGGGWAAREREGIAFEHVRGARMAEFAARPVAALRRRHLHAGLDHRRRPAPLRPGAARRRAGRRRRRRAGGGRRLAPTGTACGSPSATGAACTPTPPCWRRARGRGRWRGGSATGSRSRPSAATTPPWRRTPSTCAASSPSAATASWSRRSPPGCGSAARSNSAGFPFRRTYARADAM